MRSLKDSVYGVMDLGVVLMIGITFAGLMVMIYIIYQLKIQMWSGKFTNLGSTANNANWNVSNNIMVNITGGFSNATSLILVAITILILAIAISALLMLRGNQG